MPWTAKQLKLFRAAAHNPAIAKSSGIKQADAERMSKEGLKKAAGGLAKINKQDTRHGKVDLPFHKLNRFAGMRSGGNVKKYAKGGELERLGGEGQSQSFGQAFKEARASGADTFTWRGKKYTTEVAKGGAKSEYPPGFLERARKSEDQATSEAARIADESRRLASNYPNPRGREVSMEELSQYNYRKGGSVESKAMVKKEVGFMKKKGAPASMIKHEMAEMKGMKKGGFMRPKKDIEADQMAMAPYKKGGLKMAKGGSIKEVMGPRGMGMDVEKGSNVKRTHGEHGIQKRGHTRALEEKMAGGPKKFAAGGSIRAHGEHSIQTKGHTRGKVVMCGGGYMGKKK